MRNRPSLRCAWLPADSRNSTECVDDRYRWCSLLAAAEAIADDTDGDAEDGVGVEETQVVRLFTAFVSCSVTVANS